MSTANRKYKDSVFVDLFSEDEKAKENFLSLYNALHNTHLPLSCPVENIKLDYTAPFCQDKKIIFLRCI